MNFALVQHHKYTLTELENMIPWERQLFIDLLDRHIKKEAEKAKDEYNQMAARIRRYGK